MNAAKDAEEDLLSYVGGVRWVGKDPTDQVVDTGMVVGDEIIESRIGTCLKLSNQLGFVTYPGQALRQLTHMFYRAPGLALDPLRHRLRVYVSKHNKKQFPREYNQSTARPHCSNKPLIFSRLEVYRRLACRDLNHAGPTARAKYVPPLSLGTPNPGGIGGAEGIRTLDLLDAIEARSQLRHGPTRRVT